MWILVSLRADEGGTISLLCTALKPDPLFPDKVILENVQGVSWPFSDHWMKVHSWSVDKTLVADWKLGQVRKTFEITPELMEKGEVSVPWLEGSKPHADYVNHPDEVHGTLAEKEEEIDAALKAAQEKQVPPPPAPEPPPEPTEPSPEPQIPLPPDAEIET